MSLLKNIWFIDLEMKNWDKKKGQLVIEILRMPRLQYYKIIAVVQIKIQFFQLKQLLQKG